MTELRWAPPSRDDDVQWLGLLAAIEAVDRRGETLELDDLDDEWTSVWSHPETDALFGWNGPELVAFAWLKAMPGERAAHKVMCWGGVRPSHRRRGIGTQVLEWSLQQATEISRGFEGSLPVSVQVDATERQPDVVALATAHGFEPVRHFIETARATADAVPDLPAPRGLHLLPWSDTLDEETRLAHMEAFADHWGSEPRTPEAWKQWYTGHRGFRVDLSRLAVDRSSEQVASLVLCGAYPQDWASGPVEVWVTTVGTRPAWRGQGVGRWVLGDVLRRIADADDGFERAILGVDEENPTGALRLYRALGFTTDVRRMTLLERCPLS
ncbi:MAG: GNAT family N-acetyltransferase [Acidimicrobiales bacterium]